MLFVKRTTRSIGTTTVAAVALVLGACSSGDRDDRADTDLDPAGPAAAPTTTQPPGTEPDRVEQYIDGLLQRYDEAVSALSADPAAAADPSKPLAAEYRSLFEPGSAEAERALGAWAADAPSGERYLPFEEGGVINESKLDGPVATQSADTVTFPTCKVQSYRHYDGTGAVLDQAERRLVPGQGTAVRIDGVWYLRELVTADNLVGCATEE